MDRLSSLLRAFNPNAREVASLCLPAGARLEPTPEPVSVVYLVDGGGASLQTLDGGDATTLAEADLAWLPAGTEHRLQAAAGGATLVRATLDFGAGGRNPALDALPAVIRIGADENARRDLAPLVGLMRSEAASRRCGHQVAVNRLAEVLLVQILRHVMAHARLDRGVLAGMADTRLAAAITAIHDRPEHPWTLAALAREAGMSRTSFSGHFRAVVGRTPVEYLTLWRMRLAGRWLERGSLPVAVIGERLGYRSETAFRRAFRQTCGVTPGQLRRRAAA